jgi:3-phenylpropionate/trans-cinnamate dioxygenase ferredoxin reductase subunit
MATVVVVGGGHAGFHTAYFLRSGGWLGPIVLLDGHDAPPYQRPPLSKQFLAGKQELGDLAFRPAAFYAEHGIELRTGAPVVALDRTARTVHLTGGAPLAYDHLVLATGSRPRELTLPGADLDGVLRLATATDATLLRDRLASAERVAILGGGFIGLETASIAASAGKRVAVFEAAQRLMVRAVSEPMSRYFERLHRQHGVELHLGSTVRELGGEHGRVRSVCTADGVHHGADLVVVGIGALPDERLAADHGLATDNGILVDDRLRTSDPHISAIGDCARFRTRHASDGEHVRLESVQNATDQARFLAETLISGDGDRAYDAVPWFWTEQFGRKLQIAGLGDGADRVDQVGAPDDDRFSIYRYRGERLLSCESINSAREHLTMRRLLAGTTTLAGVAKGGGAQ